MLSIPEELASREIKSMSREELIGVLLKCKDSVRTEFTQQWLDRQTTDRLRVVLLGVLFYRLMHNQAASGEARGPTP